VSSTVTRGASRCRPGRRGGCAWRLLPPDCPTWQLVSQAFWRWRNDGTWQLMPALRRGDVRGAAGKRRQPRAGRIDHQAVQPTEQEGAPATTRPNTSMAANGTSSSTPSGGSAREWARPPACQTVTGPWPCWTCCGTTVRVDACSGPIRRRRGSSAPGSGSCGPGVTFAGRVSHDPTGFKASGCCQTAGAWGGPSPGSVGTAAYRRMMRT
jgi:hypothetical protein